MKIGLVAGEASGDLLGAGLIREEITGIAGVIQAEVVASKQGNQPGVVDDHTRASRRVRRPGRTGQVDGLLFQCDGNRRWFRHSGARAPIGAAVVTGDETYQAETAKQCT